MLLLFNIIFYNYGVDNILQNTEIRNKAKLTLMSTLGIDSSKYTDAELSKIPLISLVNKSYRLKKYILDDSRIITYQSKLELNYILYCIDNGIYIEDGDIITYTLNGVRKKYYIDFKIKEECGNYRLVEIKAKHDFWYRDLENGVILAKTIAAQKFSKERGYLPFKIYFDW